MTIDDLTDPSMDEDSVSSGKGCAYKHRTKTREIIYVEMSFHPLVFDDRFCKLVIISDITERKLLDQAQQRMHASLTQSATEWRQTFDTLDFPVLIVDREGRIHRANYCARQILGAGQHVRDLGEPKLGAKACEMLEALRQSETSISEILREETTGKSWSVSLFPVSKFRSTDRAILIVHDTTKEAELEASVRENKIMSALGTVVAGVAHEVRNPLFALSSILDALERRFSDRPEFQSYNDVLRSQIDRLIVLMEDLLEYGKPHVNDQSPESLAEMIGSSIRTCRRSAEAARITVVNCVDDKLPRIMVDKRRIATVFTNLIENAIQHSPPNSVIKIEAGKAAQGNQQWIECLVTDFGPGIKDEDLPRIFEPFFSKRPGGTGLGLPIAKKTMQEHGGGLFARNRPEGGACLIARFPIASEVNTNG